MVFAQCLVTADGVPCGRASGIFKMGQEVPGIGIAGLIKSLKG